MNSRVSLSIIFSIVAIGLIGAQQSYATVYELTDDGTCGGLVAEGIATWDDSTNTCTLIDHLSIDDANGDILNVTSSVILHIPDDVSVSDGDPLFIETFDALISVQGQIINDSEFYNEGDVDIVRNGVTGIVTNNNYFENNGLLDGDGDFINNGEFISGEVNFAGTFTNTETGTVDSSGTWLVLGDSGLSKIVNDGEFTSTAPLNIEGTLENSGTFTAFLIALDPIGTIDNTGTFTLGANSENEFAGTVNTSGTFDNFGKIILLSTGTITIDTSLNNAAGSIENYCGLITGTVTNDPLDFCPPEVAITSPTNGEKFGDVVPTEITGTATDKDEFGAVNDVTTDIMWEIKQGNDITALVDKGSPVSYLFSLYGGNIITATVTDFAGNSNSDSVNVVISEDEDGDGFVNSNDCDETQPTVNVGADESAVIDGVDTDCNPATTNPDEEDNDNDGFILGTYTAANWISPTIPIDGNDCDDNNNAVNPLADELFGDAIDNNCDGNIDEGFTDSDADGFVLETVNVVNGFVDCNDNDALINPDAVEVFDQVDNNCDGDIDEGFTDKDGDLYAKEIDDCDDNEPNVNPGIDELSVIDGVDTDCNPATTNPDEADADSDSYIVGLFTPADWLANPEPDGGSDCDDSESSVNPGADESAVIDGVDTDCNPATTNPDEADADSDSYIVGLFTAADWLAVPIPTGSFDCRDDDAAINPGAEEIANGVDDDCDGFVDYGLDDDNDGYLTGNELGVSDCDDADPAINPGAKEIFGDDIDNNCDDIIDEEKVISPVFQGDLTQKQIKKFEKLVKYWNKQIERLEDKVEDLNDRALKQDAKGKSDKAAKLRADAADKSEKIEILEDKISVVEISIGTSLDTSVFVHYQNNLSDKSVHKITKQIQSTEKKIERLIHLADKFEERADKYEDKGKIEKRDRALAKADSLRAKAAIFEDINEILICAIDYDPAALNNSDDDDDDDE